VNVNALGTNPTQLYPVCISGMQTKHSSICSSGAPPVEDQRFTVKTVYDYLRAKGKPVPTGKPQVVGHKVDLCNLAKLAFEAGGRAQVIH
jgi:hypothetical protein